MDKKCISAQQDDIVSNWSLNVLGFGVLNMAVTSTSNKTIQP